MRYFAIIVLLIAASPSWAQSNRSPNRLLNVSVHEAEIISQLKSQGYRLVEREKTWLGRIALEFESKTHEREIIVNPNSGAVIRDYKEPLDSDDKDDALGKFYGLFKKGRD